MQNVYLTKKDNRGITTERIASTATAAIHLTVLGLELLKQLHQALLYIRECFQIIFSHVTLLSLPQSPPGRLHVVRAFFEFHCHLFQQCHDLLKFVQLFVRHIG